MTEKGQIISLKEAFEQLIFMPDRLPENDDAQLQDAFATLCDYRDGSIFIGYYAGSSAWEKHPSGDEIVHILSGSTCLILLSGSEETRRNLDAGEIIIVPQGQWHRFETEESVKILTITPQPTTHSLEKPNIF